MTARASVAARRKCACGLRRLERDRAVEALERLGVAVLLLAQPAEVEDRQQEVRRDPRSPAAAGARRRRRRPALSAISASRRMASTLRGLSRSTRRYSRSASSMRPSLLVLGGERHHAPLGRQLEAPLEGGVRLLAAAEQGERLAEREPGALERGIEPRRAARGRAGRRPARPACTSR